jgi:outer membrane protein assembly factor BamB
MNPTTSLVAATVSALLFIASDFSSSLVETANGEVQEATSGFQSPITESPSNGYRFADDTRQFDANGNVIGSGPYACWVHHPGDDMNAATCCGNSSKTGDRDLGTPVLAAADGLVVYRIPEGSSSWGGVVLKHNYKGTTFYTHYGHVQHVTVGYESVKKGQQIAEIGRNGVKKGQGAHLHFEIRTSLHPAPSDGAFWQNCSNPKSLLYHAFQDLTKVNAWYLDPKTFIESHGPYSQSAPAPGFVMSAGGVDAREGHTLQLDGGGGAAQVTLTASCETQIRGCPSQHYIWKVSGVAALSDASSVHVLLSEGVYTASLQTRLDDESPSDQSTGTISVNAVTPPPHPPIAAHGQLKVDLFNIDDSLQVSVNGTVVGNVNYLEQGTLDLFSRLHQGDNTLTFELHNGQEGWTYGFRIWTGGTVEPAIERTCGTVGAFGCNSNDQTSTNKIVFTDAYTIRLGTVDGIATPSPHFTMSDGHKSARDGEELILSASQLGDVVVAFEDATSPGVNCSVAERHWNIDGIGEVSTSQKFSYRFAVGRPRVVTYTIVADCGATLSTSGIIKVVAQSPPKIPTTPCDAAQDAALLGGGFPGVSAHLTTGMTREDGQHAFQYGADNSSFVSVSGSVFTFNTALLFAPSGNWDIKLMGLDVSCNVIFGLGPIARTDNNSPPHPNANNTFSYDLNTNVSRFNDGPPWVNHPNSAIRYLWVEVWDGVPGSPRATYSYLVDVQDVQNPTPALSTQWSMFRGNPQQTGRGTTLGPASFSHFSRTILDPNRFTGVPGAPAVSALGVAYVAIHADSTDQLIAVDATGAIVPGWPVSGPAGARTFGSPALADDGTVYIIFGDALYAFNADASPKWSQPFQMGPASTPAVSTVVGSDGTIFVNHGDGRVYSISPQGALKWRSEAFFGSGAAPAIGRDGAVFVPGGTQNGCLTAFNSNGTTRWTLNCGSTALNPKTLSAAVIASDGTIYTAQEPRTGESPLFALDPASGQIKAQALVGLVDSTFSGNYFGVGVDGSILVLTTTHLVGLSPDLQVTRFRFEISPSGRAMPPVIGRDGTIFLVHYNSGTGRPSTLERLSPDGVVQSRATLGIIASPAAIGGNDVLYFGGSVDPDGGSALYSFGQSADDGVTPHIEDIRPALPLANATAQSLTLKGAHFAEGLTLVLGLPSGRTVTIPSGNLSNVAPNRVDVSWPLTTAGDYWLMAQNADGRQSASFLFHVAALKQTFFVAPPPPVGVPGIPAFVSASVDRFENLTISESFGTIGGPCLGYCGNRLLSVSPTGSLRWDAPIDASFFSTDRFAPNVAGNFGSNQTFLSGGRSTVFSVNSDGQQSFGWPRMVTASGGIFAYRSPFVVDPSTGSIFAQVGDFTAPFGSTEIVALKPDGTALWSTVTIPIGDNHDGIVRGPQGDIYTGLIGNFGAPTTVIGLHRDSGDEICRNATIRLGFGLTGGDAGVFAMRADSNGAPGQDLIAYDHECRATTIYTNDRLQLTPWSVVGTSLLAVDYQATSDPQSVRLVAIRTDGTFLWRNLTMRPRFATRNAPPGGGPAFANPIRATLGQNIYVIGDDLNDSKTKLFIIRADTGEVLNGIDTGSMCVDANRCEIAVSQTGTIYVVDTSVSSVSKIQ